MKKILGLICIISFLQITLPSYAAERALACPYQCGGVIFKTLHTWETKKGPYQCWDGHSDCDMYEVSTFTCDVYKCTGSCGYIYYDLSNCSCIGTREEHEY